MQHRSGHRFLYVHHILEHNKESDLENNQAGVKTAKDTAEDYQGKCIPVLGSGLFEISFKKFKGLLHLTIVDKDLPSLLEVEWFDALGLGITNIHSLHQDSIEDIIQEFSDVFDGTLGKYKGTPISFSIDPKIAPV